MAGDFFELFKNACNFFCARCTAYWLVEMETSNILLQNICNGKITSIYHILETFGEFNISAQNDVDFPPISLKLD
jgi:hypothetical protein